MITNDKYIIVVFPLIMENSFQKVRNHPLCQLVAAWWLLQYSV